MPLIKSAKKRVLIAAKRNERNMQMRSKFRTAIKKVKDLMSEKKIQEASAALPDAFKQIDLAAKKHLIHKNNAARKKSALAKFLASAETGKK